MAMYRRFIDLRACKEEEARELNILASTPDAVSMGSWREVLSHDPGAVDTEAARALLINHDSDQIAGTLRNIEITETGAEVRATILDGATLQTGVSVQDAVDSGALRGVSIGYTYSREDTEYDKESRTLTVRNWRLLEVSLVAQPADQKASVRSFPFDEESNRSTDAAQNGDCPMDDKNEAGQPENAQEVDTALQRAKDAETRAARAEMALNLRSIADDHGIDCKDVNFDKFENEAAGLRELLKMKAQREVSAPRDPVAPTKVVTDEADKFIGQFEDDPDAFGRFSTEDILRRCSRYDGEKVDDLNVTELCGRAASRMSYSRSTPANKQSNTFSTLCGNVANKQLLAGFDAYTPIWSAFCTTKDAVNFNVHPHVALATGRLQETAENKAFPELIQKEGTYNTELTMWGATVSVTYQALVNDELGEIMASFRRYGYAANRTIERRVFQVLLNATWTNDVTASAPLGTAGNLDKVRSGLKSKLSPSGEKMENEGKILLVDPTNRYNADAATGQLYGVGTGGNQMVGSNAGRGYSVLDSTFVGDTSLFGSALTTDYYLINDPMLADTITVEFLRGQRQPRIEEFDAGATAASKYKIMLPFQATVATHTDGDGNARVTGMQKATA